MFPFGEHQIRWLVVAVVARHLDALAVQADDLLHAAC